MLYVISNILMIIVFIMMARIVYGHVYSMVFIQYIKRLGYNRIRDSKYYANYNNAFVVSSDHIMALVDDRWYSGFDAFKFARSPGCYNLLKYLTCICNELRKFKQYEILRHEVSQPFVGKIICDNKHAGISIHIQVVINNSYRFYNHKKDEYYEIYLINVTVKKYELDGTTQDIIHRHGMWLEEFIDYIANDCEKLRGHSIDEITKHLKNNSVVIWAKPKPFISNIRTDANKNSHFINCKGRVTITKINSVQYGSINPDDDYVYRTLKYPEAVLIFYCVVSNTPMIVVTDIEFTKYYFSNSVKAKIVKRILCKKYITTFDLEMLKQYFIEAGGLNIT